MVLYLRYIIPYDIADEIIDESPFELDTLDPRYAFVVYNNGFGKKPLMESNILKLTMEKYCIAFILRPLILRLRMM